MTATTLSSHRKVPPYGVGGAESGQCGRNAVVRADGTIDELAGNDRTEVLAGDTFLMETPGGGGFGPT